MINRIGTANSIKQDIVNISKELYTPKQKGILKVLAYFLVFAVIKDAITHKGNCYKECAEKCDEKRGGM